MTKGGFRGGGGRPSPSGIRPPADPKGPPFVLFSNIHFWQWTLKIFQRRLGRQYILILRGECARKKRNFSIKIKKKTYKRFFWVVFFQNFASGAEILARTGTKQCFGRARKIISLVDLKKGRQKFRHFFENPPSPLEKILDPPLIMKISTSLIADIFFQTVPQIYCCHELKIKNIFLL